MDINISLKLHLHVTLQRIPITDRMKSMNTNSSSDTFTASNLTAPKHSPILRNYLSFYFPQRTFQVTLLLLMLPPVREALTTFPHLLLLLISLVNSGTISSTKSSLKVEVGTIVLIAVPWGTLLSSFIFLITFHIIFK